LLSIAAPLSDFSRVFACVGTLPAKGQALLPFAFLASRRSRQAGAGMTGSMARGPSPSPSPAARRFRDRSCLPRRLPCDHPGPSLRVVPLRPSGRLDGPAERSPSAWLELVLRVRADSSLLTCQTRSGTGFKPCLRIESSGSTKRYLFAIGLLPVFSLRWNLPPVLG